MNYESEIPTVCKDLLYINDGVPVVKGIEPQSKTFSISEKIFDIPFIYNLKVALCKSLTKWTPINITPYLKDKDVLNIGCGPDNCFFNASLPSKITGFDISAESVKSIKKQDPNGFYFVGSGDKIPFPDNHFDVAVVFFVLHHLPFDMEKCFKEAKRVSRSKVIIFDHKLHDSKLFSTIQSLYWRIFDGGKKYNRRHEWHKLFANDKVEVEEYTGSMFKNISQFVIDVSSEKNS